MTPTPTSSNPSNEHLDVLIVGAGLSGVAAGHYVKTRTPWASFAMFEARDAIGGTWDLFRYPGLRSDSDMFTLGYSFRPWKGRKSIADGDSILRYIEDSATEDGLHDHIRFKHRVVAADWSSEHGHWVVTATREDPESGETTSFDLTVGFIISCSGYYRYDQGHAPAFDGTERFPGAIVHPQHWPEDLDVSGKRIVVIGSGATAITLIPALAETAQHVTMLQRSPTYIAAVPAVDPIANLLRTVLPTRVSGPTIRWMKALTTQGSYVVSKRWPGLVKRVLRAQAKRQLPRGFDIDTHFTPRYDPWDQRLCVAPNGDFFEVIRNGTASVVTDHVDTFTESGVRVASGDELDADIIVTATGLELLFLGGIDLRVDGAPVVPSEKFVYKGMMLDGVPNLAIAIGYANASWSLKVDLTLDYTARILDHMHRTGHTTVEAVCDLTDAVDEPFFGLSSGYMQRARDRMPRQGSRYPWRQTQSYLRDYRLLRSALVTDGVLRYTTAGSEDHGDAPQEGPTASVPV